MVQSQDVNVWAFADSAFRLQLRAYIFSVLVAAARARENPPSPLVEPARASPAPPEPDNAPAATTPEVQPGTGGVWSCIANAETGGDFTMHGSTYSTAYGIINDIVYEYASPEVQARVFSGTASASEQLDIVTRFAADHGFGGWGVLTREKCGL